jgi:hypothetical protein|tara:strand:- start:14526 stop:14669 length:144 start_codon:yes stop_codon:yes gene_type:complete
MASETFIFKELSSLDKYRDTAYKARHPPYDRGLRPREVIIPTTAKIE